MLPGWRLLTLETDADGCVPGDVVAHCTIVTEHFLAQAPLDVHTLLRATGGPHPLELYRPRPTLLEDARLELHDFTQVGENGLDRDTQVRLRDYARRGWPVTFSQV